MFIIDWNGEHMQLRCQSNFKND